MDNNRWNFVTANLVKCSSNYDRTRFGGRPVNEVRSIQLASSKRIPCKLNLVEIAHCGLDKSRQKVSFFPTLHLFTRQAVDVDVPRSGAAIHLSDYWKYWEGRPRGEEGQGQVHKKGFALINATDHDRTVAIKLNALPASLGINKREKLFYS